METITLLEKRLAVIQKNTDWESGRLIVAILKKQHDEISKLKKEISELRCKQENVDGDNIGRF